MSSPAAGRFQDHYEVLGVDHKATTDAIQASYTRMAEKYHPKTGIVPDAEKFESITLAFEVLSDPELRADFNKLKGIGGDEKPKFSGEPFFEAYRRDSHLRVGLLCVLYDRRRSKPFTPALSMRHIEAIFNASSQELNFALWYLKQRELVVADDKSSLQITVNGMDYLVANPATPELVMPMIKASSVLGNTVDEDAAEAAEKAAAEKAELDQAAEVAAEPEVSAPTPFASPIPISSDSVNGSAARIGDLLARRKVS
jgi:hypothetical protein